MHVLRRVTTVIALGAALFSVTAVSSANATTTGPARAIVNAVVADAFRCVVAEDMRVFSSATSNRVVGILPTGEIVHVIGHSGIRYHIDYPVSGWISDDPRWTVPC
jgi:hypothetical protein